MSIQSTVIVLVVLVLVLTPETIRAAGRRPHSRRKCSPTTHTIKSLHSPTWNAAKNGMDPWIKSLSTGSIEKTSTIATNQLILYRGGATKTLEKETLTSTQVRKDPIAIDPMAKMILLWFHHVPKPLRFFLSGRVGDVIFFFLERWLSVLLGAMLASFDLSTEPSGSRASKVVTLVVESKDSITFLGGFLLHIVPQHLLHAVLVFGLTSIDTREKYWKTLIGMYQGLITTSILLTLLNTCLLKKLAMPKGIAFVLTQLIASTVNYFWLGWLVQRSKQPPRTKSE